MNSLLSKSMTQKDNKPANPFAQGILLEKHERIARNSLYDMFAFYESLKKEIHRIGELPEKLNPAEAEILARMLAVQEHYLAAMQGFSEQGAEMQQHALIRFSDALLDMMKVIHKYQRH